MDYYQSSNQNGNVPTEDPRLKNLSIASMVCGILSMVLCCTGILSIPAGALGILFALLTRRTGKRMPTMCITGIWLSCVGMVLGIIITVNSFVTLFTNPAYLEMLDSMYRQLYGVGIEEFWNSNL